MEDSYMKDGHVYVHARFVLCKKICSTYPFQRAVNQNGDVSGPMCIYIFYLFMVTQHILKFMKDITESPCILYRPICILGEFHDRAKSTGISIMDQMQSVFSGLFFWTATTFVFIVSHVHKIQQTTSVSTVLRTF
jgi:hypothetical protein